MNTEPRMFVAFAGSRVIARGTLDEVVLRSKARLDQGKNERIALFDDQNGSAVDIDFTGTDVEVLARLAAHPMVAPDQPKTEKQRGPGRPRLGVISREVSLLPRHWSWLAEQRGGASATLRRLVDTARKSNTLQEEAGRAIEAAHRFMWDMAGDDPGFEEASRSLFAQDFETFARLISGWPIDIQEQLGRFVARARRMQPQ